MENYIALIVWFCVFYAFLIAHLILEIIKKKNGIDVKKYEEEKVKEKIVVVTESKPAVKLTYEESLAKLSKEQKSYYKQIKAHIAEIEETSCSKTKSFELCSYKKNYLVRISVARETLALRFQINNQQVDEYTESNKDKYVKPAPFTVKVVNQEACNSAIAVIDIAKSESDAKLAREAQ